MGLGSLTPTHPHSLAFALVPLSTSFIPLVSKTINQRKDSYTTKGSFIFPLTLFHSSLHFTCLRLSISILASAPLRAHSLSDVGDYHSISGSLIRFTVGGRFSLNVKLFNIMSNQFRYLICVSRLCMCSKT